MGVLRINYNFQADFAWTNLLKTERNLNGSIEKLSTGYRINSAKDDAAGLFIADQLNLVANALDQGVRNAQDGISAAQIAETTLAQIYDKLVSIYTKAEQAANDTNSAINRQAIQEDINKLIDAIDRIASSSEFNGQKLLDGSFVNKVIHYGPRADQTLSISVDSARAADLQAYIWDGTGNKTNLNVSFNDFLIDTTVADYVYTATDKVIVAGVDLSGNLTDGALVDAKTIADAINKDTTLQGLGIEASAKNRSVGTTWSNINVGNDDTVTISFAVGNKSNLDFSITYGAGSTITLDDLIARINSKAAETGVALRASKEDNKLVLETDGETIAVEVKIEDSTAGDGDITSINLAQIIEGGATLTETDGGIAAQTAVKVGDLTIVGTDNYSVDFTGLGALNAKSVSVTGNNLYSIDVTNNEKAENALRIINAVIKKVDKQRANLGSIQINLETIIQNNEFSAVQQREAESRIRNVDFAKEMANFTRYQTLMQSGMAMMAQANQLPQMVLQLLR